MNIPNEQSHSFMHSFILPSCTDTQTSKGSGYSDDRYFYLSCTV